MDLSPAEWDMCNVIEQFWFIDGSVPTIKRISEALGIPLETAEKTVKSKNVFEALKSRGIMLGKSSELLTTEQLAGLAAFFDTKDGRSLKKKLNDIDITTQEWDAWKKDTAFAEHFRERAERSILTNLAETEVAMMDSAHRGDVSAIKLHLELAGRWSSKTVGELNVDFLLMKILETCQKYVKDPLALQAIANDLSALSPSPVSNPTALPSAIIPGGVGDTNVFSL